MLCEYKKFEFGFGFGNFVEVVNYPEFKTCLKNTLLLCVLTVPISCFLALLVSVGLNSIPKFSAVLQTIYFLPYVTNSIAIGMVFAMMFNIVGLTPMQVENYNNLSPEKQNGLFWITEKVIPGGCDILTGICSDEQRIVTGQTAGSWGLINSLIMALGFDPVIWINQGSTYTANIAVMVIYIVWNALPFKILILLVPCST